MICAACGRLITDDQRSEAVVWLDPGSRSCVAHDVCLAVYDEVLAELLQDPCMEVLYGRRPGLAAFDRDLGEV